MGDFFGGLHSGVQFPQVVMNQGPLPSAGGLPQPLHDTPDARINYGSSLLGDLTPYAYGEPGYLSSQNAYLNIPHKIQKIVPVVFLPEAKVGAKEFFDLSHPIDDGDLAFVLRLDRSSLFCTGLKNGSMRRAGLGTAIDPLINLCTLNYILSGLQYGVTGGRGDLWAEFFYNLDKRRFGKPAGAEGARNYQVNRIELDDVMHVVRTCIRPFGVTRGSEKQGGQDEATLSAATWPVSFVVSLTIDGKESNVVNLWHHHELHAGDDLVLRLKLMPLMPYTLNHYYKGIRRQNWSFPPGDDRPKFVWQLVPDLFHLDAPNKQEQAEMAAKLPFLPTVPAVPGVVGPGAAMLQPLLWINARYNRSRTDLRRVNAVVGANFAWQEAGYWHIGRSQVQTGKYGSEDIWHNDTANSLRTNHLDMTFQPMHFMAPCVGFFPGTGMRAVRLGDEIIIPFGDEGLPAVDAAASLIPVAWSSTLGLERLLPDEEEVGGDSFFPSLIPELPEAAEDLPLAEEEMPPSMAAPGADDSFMEDSEVAPVRNNGVFSLQASSSDTRVVVVDEEEEPDWLGRLESADDLPPSSTSTTSASSSSKKPPLVAAPPSVMGRATKRSKAGGGGGSLLKPDGSSEPSMVGML